MKALTVFALAALLASGPCWAEERPPTLKLTPALDTAQAKELLRLFNVFCIENYPDESAVVASLGKVGATRMAAEFVQDLLDGPGLGWRLQGENGPFIITLKAEPDPHCAVRAPSDRPFAPLAWREFLRRTAAARKADLSGDIDYDDVHADGSVAHAFVNLLSVSRLENFTMIVDEYEQRGQHRVQTRLMRRLLPLSPPH